MDRDAVLHRLDRIGYGAQDDSNNTVLEGDISLSCSPCGSFCALWSAAKPTVYIYDADSPSTGPISHFLVDTYGAAEPGRLAVAWRSDSAALAVADPSGCLQLVSRQASQLHSWQPFSGHSWDRLAALTFSGSRILAISARGHLQQLSTDQADTLLLQTQKHHKQPQSLAVCEELGLLAVVGDYSKRAAAAPTISLWTVEGSATSLCTWGRRPLISGWLAALQAAEAVMVSTAFSAGGSQLLVQRQGSAPLVFILEAQDGVVQLQHLTTPSIPSITCSAWWGRDSLLLAMANGEVAIAGVPGLQALPGGHLEAFQPGTQLSGAQPAKGRSAVVWLLEPAVASGSASSSPSAAGFRLHCMQQQTPEQRLLHLLTEQQWPAALSFAQEHGLSSDHVSRARWVAEGITEDSITQTLGSIQDPMWIVERCVSSVAPEAHLQEQLLCCGLAETAAQLEACADGDQGQADTTAWLCKRLQLLQHRERLATLKAFSNGAYTAAAFEDFRDCLIREAAMACARASSLERLQKLLQRHAYVLMPSVLDILACLPETLHPSVLQDLLPKADSEAPALAHDPDQVESQNVLEQLQAGGHHGLLIATEHMAELYLGWCPPSTLQVARWFMERSMVVDARTGSLSLAAQYLQAGLQGGDFEGVIEGCDCPLETLLLEVQTAASAGTSSQRAWQVSLREYAAAGPSARLRMLLSPADDPEVEADRGILRALLQGLSAEERTAKSAGIMGNLAADRLPWCASLFRAECFRLQAFESPAELAAAAVACVHGLSAGTDWGLPSEILLAVKHALSANQFSTDSADQQSDAHLLEAVAQLDQARTHVKGAELLGQLGQATTPQKLARADKAAIARLLRTCLARLSRSRPPPSDARWSEVWRMLRELQAGAWASLPATEALAELCRALLRCGNWRLARSYLLHTASTPLPSDLAEQIVLAAGREYFHAANAHDAPEIAEACQCLAVLPDSSAVRQELDAINGFRQLSDWGISMLPMQFHQVADRMDIVQQALMSVPYSYHNPASIMRLAQLLGVAQRSQEVQLLLAKAAANAEDWPEVVELVQPLVAEGFVPAWPTAAAAACKGSASVRNDAVLRSLLAFSLAHCSTEEMPELLDRLEAVQPESSSAMPADARQLAVQALQAPVNVAPAAGLPDLGDMHLATAALLRLSPVEVTEVLAECRSRQPVGSRLDLLGLFVCSLQALSLSSQQPDQSAAAQRYLTMPPRQVWQQLALVADDSLNSAAQQAKQHAATFHKRLTADSELRILQALLPSRGGMDAVLQQGSQADLAQMNELLTEAAAAAGASSNPAVSEDALDNVLQLAGRFGIDPARLRLHYLCSYLTHHQDVHHKHLLQLAQPQIQSLPSLAAGMLSRHVWPAILAGSNHCLAACLQMLWQCLSAVAAEQPQSEHDQDVAKAADVLSQAASFVQQCLQAASGLEAKIFVQPLLQPLIASLVELSVEATGQGLKQGLTWLSSSAHLSLPMMQQLADHVSTANAAQLNSALQLMESHLVCMSRGGDISLTAVLHIVLACKLMGTCQDDEGDTMHQWEQALPLLKLLPPALLTAVARFLVLHGPEPLQPWPQLPQVLLTQDVKVVLVKDVLHVLQSRGTVEDANSLQQEASALMLAQSIQQQCQLSVSELQVVQLALQQAQPNAASLQAALQSSMQTLAGQGTSLLQLLNMASCPSRLPAEADSASKAAAMAQDAVLSALGSALAAVPAQDPQQQQSHSGALHGVVACLAAAPAAEQRDGWGSGSDAGWQVDVDDDVSAAVQQPVQAQLVQQLRDGVWQRLEAAMLSDGLPGELKQEVMHLLTALAPAAGVSRWPGWVADAGAGTGRQTAMLLSQSLMQLTPAFSPLPQLQPLVIASGASAQAWFLKLLQAAEGEGQLEALAGLLSLAWRHGSALPDSQELQADTSDTQQAISQPGSGADSATAPRDPGASINAAAVLPSPQAHASAYIEDGWDTSDLPASSAAHADNATAAPAVCTPPASPQPDCEDGWGSDTDLSLPSSPTPALEASGSPTAAPQAPPSQGWDFGIDAEAHPDQPGTPASPPSACQPHADPRLTSGAEQELDRPEEGGQPLQAAACPLHACWSALVTRALRGLQPQLVVRWLDRWQELRPWLMTAAETDAAISAALRQSDVGTACIVHLLAPHSVPKYPLGKLAQKLEHVPVSQISPSLLCVLLVKGKTGCPAWLQFVPPLMCTLMTITAVFGVQSRPDLFVGQKVHSAAWQGLLVAAAAVQLCLQQRYREAAVLAVHHSALHPGLATVDEGLAVLDGWLSAHLRMFEGVSEPDWTRQRDELYVRHSMHELWRRLQNECSAALHQLRQEVGRV